MEGSTTPGGSTATVRRPALPPLPPGLRVEREAADPTVVKPIRAAQPTQAVQFTSPAEPAAAPVAVAQTPAAQTPGVQARLEGLIERPKLPPTPPELAPLNGPAPSLPSQTPELSTEPAVGTMPSAPPIEDDTASDIFSSTLPGETDEKTGLPKSKAGSVIPETPEFLRTDEDEDSGKKRRGKKARGKKARGKKSQGKKAEAKTGKTKLKAPSTAGLGEKLKRVGLAVFVLALLGAAAFFGSRLLSSTSIVSSLEPGECVQNFFDSNDDGAVVEILAVATVDSTEPHAYEVFSMNETLFPDDEYPGVAESFAVGQEFCLNEYQAFIGGGQENLSTWDVWTFVPPESGWSDERRVHCLIGDAAQTTLTTGTLEGIAAAG